MVIVIILASLIAVKIQKTVNLLMKPANYHSNDFSLSWQFLVIVYITHVITVNLPKNLENKL